MGQPTQPIERRAIPPEATETMWIAADDWPVRRIDWPAAGARGAVLFMVGRADFYEKYLEMLQQIHRQGWAVTAIDWRGQAGSGRLLPASDVGHVDDFGPWIADLGAFWKAWAVERPGPHLLFGHSMGGHIALRAVADGVVNPDGLALSAPMLGLKSGGLPRSVGRSVADFMVAVGCGQSPAWIDLDMPLGSGSLRRSVLTHDATRYDDETFWFAERPALRVGPPSWSWIVAAMRSIAALDQPGTIEGVDVPVILFAAGHDQLVSSSGIRRAAARLPDCELISYGQEAAHEIFREVDAVRDDALGRLLGFFERVAGGERVAAA